jgi:hypothetical protein
MTDRPIPPWDALLHRRDLLRVGSLGVAATALPALFTGTAAARPAPKTGPATARSVIVLWMAGGVTHIDSFDPKPGAPREVRGPLRAIDTALPGIRFCETLPCLAREVRHLAVLRCFSHDTNDHLIGQAYVLSGRHVAPSQIMTEPNLGSIVAHLLGPRGGFPGYVAVPGTTRPGPPPYNMFVGGWLGKEYAPFATGGAPRNEDFTAKVLEPAEEEFNMQALQYAQGVTAQRLDGRRSLREQLEAGLRRAEAAGHGDALARQYGGAFEMLLSPSVRRAFELNREPDPVRDRYGRTKVGQRCLLARRLVEAGARFVMVDYGYDPEYGNLWDNHCVPIQNQPPIYEMAKRPYHLAGMDRAFAALITDLEARGRLADTLVVFLTEFGRTPALNQYGGRDHWGAAGSIFFAGGGTRGGQVIGATDRSAAQPTGVRYGPWDVAATIYHALGMDLATVLHDRQNRPIAMLPEGQVIPGIF